MSVLRALSKRRPIGQWFWIAAAVSLAISLTRWAPVLLYPFKLFTTWVHESSHAVMTVLVGGRVASITIEPDTSGLTRSLLPASRIARGLVASAGYLGASVVGCLLMAATRIQKWAHVILLSIGVCMLLTIALWMRNPFGVIVVFAWAVALIALARKGVANALRFVLSLLAIQVALNAVYDIRVLFLIGRAQSDAAAMEQLFLLPSWLWASAWMIVSVAMLVATLRATADRF